MHNRSYCQCFSCIVDIIFCFFFFLTGAGVVKSFKFEQSNDWVFYGYVFVSSSEKKNGGFWWSEGTSFIMLLAEPMLMRPRSLL